MIKETLITLLPDELQSEDTLKLYAARQLGITFEDINAIQKIKKSIDARPRFPVYKILLRVFIDEEPEIVDRDIQYKPVKSDKRVIVVGSGPAGLFSSLRLIEHGIKPIILERGQDVKGRRRDLKAIQRDHIVNPESNFCFGEGGAGTYSDGKLYTRSVKRGNVGKILHIFAQHGAPEEVLYESHPHIGSNKLPKIIQNMRETIINAGGEVSFNSKVTDLIIKNKKIRGVIVNDDTEIIGDAVILATGHSARDIFYMLDKKKIKLDAKPFAMGVRIEHPQKLIDEIQYHSTKRDPHLPAATYGVNCHIDDRAVFSFCMCPGGIIVPGSTAPGELVVNGMSVSRRDSKFANSGFVVEISDLDLLQYEKYGAFAGLQMQKELERAAFIAGGSNQTAPSQRVTDFIDGKISSSLPKCSYIPGVVSAPLHEILPKQISERLRLALFEFEKKLPGYITQDAQMVAAETRTSSPVRITRDRETYMHVEIEGLFPSGEGAGYAGGIVSAAIDGENCADAVSRYL